MQDAWRYVPTDREAAVADPVETVVFPIDLLWRFPDVGELSRRWEEVFDNISTRYNLLQEVSPQHARFLQERGFWLLTNALDSIRDRSEASPDKPFIPQVRVHTTKKEGRLRLEIEDNGRGFTPEGESSLFTPYSSTKVRGTRYGGMGGALYGIREEAEQMGDCSYGYINKGVNRGAAFWLGVPYGRRQTRR